MPQRGHRQTPAPRWDLTRICLEWLSSRNRGPLKLSCPHCVFLLGGARVTQAHPAACSPRPPTRHSCHRGSLSRTIMLAYQESIIPNSLDLISCINGVGLRFSYHGFLSTGYCSLSCLREDGRGEGREQAPCGTARWKCVLADCTSGRPLGRL